MLDNIGYALAFIPMIAADHVTLILSIAPFLFAAAGALAFPKQAQEMASQAMSFGGRVFNLSSVSSFTEGSFYTRVTDDSSHGYAKAAVDTSYRLTNNWTHSFWIMAGPSINKNIFSQWEETGNKRAFLYSTQADGKFRTIFSWDGTNFSLHKTHTAVFDYSWIHIMVSFASGVQTVYVNNVAQTMDQTIAWGGGAAGLFASDAQVMIGAKNPASPPNDDQPGGCVTNFSMWNKVLSAGERTELYNNGSPKDLSTHSAYASCTNWWRCDQSDTAPTLVDSKNGSASDMTITASGTSGVFAASSNYPSYSQDPGVANVASGTTYVIEGVNLTGTLVPVTVVSGVQFAGPRSMGGN